MSVTVKKAVGKATVSKSVSDNKSKTPITDESKDEDVQLVSPSGQAKLVPEPTCEVGVDASYTKNLGNFQSAKVGVSLRVPCAHGDIDDVFAYAKDWVNNKLSAIIEEL